ncbi:PorT family protein [Flavobacteriaceae bacterium TP-CH-4]|uniref:PorT family protein n=1 Tax=Pelagihabitans pacificus TaxID=2696054 RepID=A0A967EEY4_9FLAO|nr:porin family protein [Pelagihabitans pacificus]NHF60843.1 PorT family protein [Pelagihabitans pacificus]
MRKAFFLLLTILFSISTTLAQFKENPVLNIENKDKRFLNYGYFLGFNQYDFKFDYKNDLGEEDEVLVDKSIGFNVGLIGEMRLNEFLDLRFEPGLHYNARNLVYTKFPEQESTPVNILREVKSTYINFPLLLKVSTKRFGNWKPFLIGGPSASLNLGSNETNLDDNSSGTFRMKKWNYNYELGFGIDFYLEYFKFTPSIRGVFTITDELVPDVDPNSPWTGNIDAMRTRGLFINFTFE